MVSSAFFRPPPHLEHFSRGSLAIPGPQAPYHRRPVERPEAPQLPHLNFTLAPNGPRAGLSRLTDSEFNKTYVITAYRRSDQRVDDRETTESSPRFTESLYVPTKRRSAVQGSSRL